MSIDMKPENTTFPIDQPSDTPLGAATDARNFFKSRTALALGVGSLGLIFGLLIHGGDGTQAVQAPVPVTTVAELGTAPASCLEALDRADRAMSLAGDGFTMVSRSYSALGQGNIASAAGYVSQLTGITDQMTLLTPDYVAAKASCRGL